MYTDCTPRIYFVQYGIIKQMKIHFGGLSDSVKNRSEYYRAIRRSILDHGHEITRDWIEKEMKGNEKLSFEEQHRHF